jgi:hypothetical protein
LNIDLHTSLILAGAKATAIILALEVTQLEHDPSDRIQDIIEETKHRLGVIAQVLIEEGNREKS